MAATQRTYISVNNLMTEGEQENEILQLPIEFSDSLELSSLPSLKLAR